MPRQPSSTLMASRQHHQWPGQDQQDQTRYEIESSLEEQSERNASKTFRENHPARLEHIEPELAGFRFEERREFASYRMPARRHSRKASNGNPHRRSSIATTISATPLLRHSSTKVVRTEMLFVRDATALLGHSSGGRNRRDKSPAGRSADEA